jgi:putative FmdB family regulatory protein
MATFVYECQKCGEIEVEQRVGDEALTCHASCGSPMMRVIPSRMTFQLKGAGWYADGYDKVGDAKKQG